MRAITSGPFAASRTAEVAVASSSSTRSAAATARASATAAPRARTPSSLIEPSGAEVAHEAQHGALARRGERPAARAHVGDQQMDGVRTDVEDSEAHGLRVSRAHDRRGRFASGRRATRHPLTRYDERDVRRRRASMPGRRHSRSRSTARSTAPSGRGWPPAWRSRSTETEIVQIRGLGDRLDMAEVARGVPAAVAAAVAVRRDRPSGSAPTRARSSREPDTTTPFVVGVAGLGRRRQVHDRAPAARAHEPLAGHAAGRAGHDRRLPLPERRARAPRAHGAARASPSRTTGARSCSFLTEVKSGAPEVRAPFYSHMRYDIVPDAHVTVRRPDVVIVEGLNVLQPPPTPNDVAVSDLFDFSIYVDADSDHIAQWFVDRFLALRRGRVQQPELVLQRLRAPLRRRGGRDGARLLERHQPAEPRGERAADQAPARRSCWRRPPTTPSSGCCCASCDADGRGSVSVCSGSSHTPAAYH